MFRSIAVRSCLSCVALGFLTVCSSPVMGTSCHVVFAPAAASEPGGSGEIQGFVKQLGSDEFNEREAATKRLKVVGEPALDALHKALTSDDLEVRRRARRIVAAIEDRLYPELRLTGHTGGVWSVCVSADGKRLLTSSADRTLRLWDAHTGKQLRVFEGHTAEIYGAALSPDGKRVLSGSGDKTVRLWDATTGKELRKMTGHAEEVCSVAFGPEGKALSGGDDRTMRLWDLNTGKNAGVFTGHTGYVRGVAYSDQAKLAATCGCDRSIRLWDLETGKEVRKLTGHTAATVGQRLLLAGRQAPAVGELRPARVRIWDVETGKELKRIKAPSRLLRRVLAGRQAHRLRRFA